jgi:hypothetical protein
MSAKEGASGELVGEDPVQYGGEGVWGKLKEFGGETVEAWGFVWGHGLDGGDKF